MAQFDVYRMADGELALDVQTDRLGAFDTRLVVPLMLPAEAPVRHRRLNPMLDIGGESYVMVTQFMIAVDRPELGKPVDNLDRYYDDIKSAYDMMFNGF